MKYLVILAGIFLSTASYGQNTQEIFSIISKIQPNNTEGETAQIASEVDTFSHRENLDWKLILAIFAQESTFQKDPQNCVAGLQRCHDFGIGQINYRTWGRYFKLDKKRLVTDYTYSIKSSVDILVYYRSVYGFSDKNWFLRYHSSTPALRAAYRERIIYQSAKINKYLKEFVDGRQRAEKFIGYRSWRFSDPYSLFGPSELLYAGTTSGSLYIGEGTNSRILREAQSEPLFCGTSRKRRAMG